MDSVTEADMCVSIAKMGGVGILHRNMDADAQAGMVQYVRRKIHSGGMIDSPTCFHPDQRFSDVQRGGFSFTSFPITDSVTGRLVGLVTRDEMDFVENTNPLLADIMKPLTETVTAPEGTTTDAAYATMTQKRVKKLPVVRPDGTLAGMFVWNDVRDDQRKRSYYSLDDDGRFLVGAAIGVDPVADLERARKLVGAGCRLVCVDSSHGACTPVAAIVAAIKREFPSLQVIAGNVASYRSAMYLMSQSHQPDAIKVGIGPGSICTTRRVTGHGVPQATAIFEVWRAVRDASASLGKAPVPVIADGGIRSSGDVVKALACGASCVMLGSMLAGTDESPGRLVTWQGKKYKSIRGMGSRAAMAQRSGSRDRYLRQDAERMAEDLTQQQLQKIVPEGTEGLVERTGSVEKVLFEVLGGIGSGMAHSGARCVQELQSKAAPWLQGPAGIAEGNPHSLVNQTN